MQFLKELTQRFLHLTNAQFALLVSDGTRQSCNS